MMGLPDCLGKYGAHSCLDCTMCEAKQECFRLALVNILRRWAGLQKEDDWGDGQTQKAVRYD